MTTDAGWRAVELTQQLVQIRSVNPGGTEADVAVKLHGLFADAGFDVVSHEFASGRVSLVATFLPKKRLTGLPIGLAGHIDTVPLGATPWQGDPFSGQVRDGKLWGRGSSDMKSGVAAAAVAAVEAAGSGDVGNGVVVVICAGEETGCEGASALAESDLLPAVGTLVVTEPSENDVLVAHKGALWLRVVATGTTAHGSMPHLGDNALARLLPAIRAMEDVELSGTHHLLGRPTRTLSQVHGGLNVNSVPDRAEATFDIRTIPGMDERTLLSDLTRAAGVDVEVEAMTQLPPLDTAADDPWVTRIRKVVERATGRPQPGGAVSYFTDASVLTAAMGSATTIVCGPGIAEQAHRTDEHCRVADIHASVEILKTLIAGPPAG